MFMYYVYKYIIYSIYIYANKQEKITNPVYGLHPTKIIDQNVGIVIPRIYYMLLRMDAESQACSSCGSGVLPCFGVLYILDFHVFAIYAYVHICTYVNQVKK